MISSCAGGVHQQLFALYSCNVLESVIALFREFPCLKKRSMQGDELILLKGIKSCDLRTLEYQKLLLALLPLLLREQLLGYDRVIVRC